MVFLHLLEIDEGVLCYEGMMGLLDYFHSKLNKAHLGEKIYKRGIPSIIGVQVRSLPFITYNMHILKHCY